MVGQANEDIVWELPGQVVLHSMVFLLPLLNGLFFHVCGVGGILQNGMHGCSIKVAPLVHGLHGFLETHGKDGPVGGIIMERWDGGEKCWKRHSTVVRHVAAI